MVCMVPPQKCWKCKRIVTHRFLDGICADCLIKKFRNGFTLEKAKKKMCGCYHKELERLYAQSQEKPEVR